MKRRSNGIMMSKLIYLVPALVVMIIFFLWPIIMTIYYSFTNLALTGTAAANLEFVALDNYKKLFNDPAVINSILMTLIFTIGSVVGQSFLGFVIALLMKNKNKTFRRIVGPIILAGWVMPEIVCAVCAYSFFTDKGTLNAMLSLVGAAKVAWLFQYPMIAVILANIWHGTAFSMMVYQSALDNVSEEVQESAKLDGISTLQNIFYIIIPIIKDTIMTNTMLITLMTLGGFGMIYVMTGGGPGIQTQTLPVLMYIRAFKNYQLGYGTAISMILLVIAVLFSVFYTRIAGKEMGEKNEAKKK